MSELDTFGELVMTRLRDRTLDYAGGLMRHHWKAPSSQKLQADLAQLPSEHQAVVVRCVRASVDYGIHAFLVGLREALEDGDIAVTVHGKNLLDLSEQLEGELFSEDGWQAQFSKYGEAPEEA